MEKIKLSASAIRRKKSIDLKYNHVKLLIDFFNLGFHSFDAFYTSFYHLMPKYRNEEMKQKLEQYYLHRITSKEINEDLEAVIDNLKST